MRDTASRGSLAEGWLVTRLVSIAGVHHAPEDAKVSVYDRGFLYGDSVFETVRTYGGKPFALSEHMERLERSAERVGIEMPISKEAFAGEVISAVEAAGNDESYVRAMLTRGSGPMGLDPSVSLVPLRVILVEPLKTLPETMYEDGVGVVLVRTDRASDAAEGAKVGNYLASVLALAEARKAGAHEALIINRHGEVAEGTTSNLFLVRGGTLVTPPVDAGILAGITRAYVLEAAHAQGIEVELGKVRPKHLRDADEVFISSSIRELLPVVFIDGRPVGDGRPGPVTRRLHRAFRERVASSA